ncbi:MAG: response regulator [Deltaproteobacteria bacterium]|nr:response regulator [Deltaproteobacteria bacterium]MBW2050184.1 response regulator [Deltaproteobacteria bacterium]MBW2110072.1 response regulator [Deltaproteobacteria bacterium]MBW2352955.1 response regulator [Deltaproteobacteria bacterium]HDZ90460.1 response regulator [Deltaproteobacteria bacterium]
MQKVILIVEDDVMNRKLFRDFLNVKGYRTLEAADGKEGAELAKTERPDLILMDIRMPGMDGLEATRILKADEKTTDIPVVALTAYAMQGDQEKVLDAGFDGYITKPVGMKELLKTVVEYLPE